MNIKSCWITINRACNLRCRWCYAKDTNFEIKDDMPLEIAYKIIDICKELDVKHITLIGGEPSIYKNLDSVIEYCHQKRIYCGFPTNGILLNDEKFLDRMEKLKIKNFSVSLKGENPEKYLEVSGKNMFDTVLNGVKKAINKGFKINISMVLTKDNIPTFVEGIKTFYDIGVRNFNLSFCYEFNLNSDTREYLKKQNPSAMIEEFVKIYPKLNESCHGHFTLFQTFPFCLWDDKFIALLLKRHQINSICQLNQKSGILFDNEGYIIPCNAMYEIKIGKLYKDFSTGAELLNYMNTKKVKGIYRILCGVPDIKCIDCKKLSYCAGGCVCQYTNYSLSDIIVNKEGEFND